MNAISVENLGKKYLIRHQKEPSELSDVLGVSARRIVKRLNPFVSSKRSAYREDFWALRNVCFNILEGERVGIIGRNGSGKSTLLKILSRITEPTEGRARIRGRVASLLEVGTGFHPELTGRENIYLNGAILGMSKSEIKKRFDEIVSFAEIEKFLDTPVKRYSSGMYVRLAFAVAAHLEPEILMVDEVLAVGDVQFQKKCLGKMGEIGQGSRTILFVSHNMAAISKLCNRSIWLDLGKVKQVGDTESVISMYLSQGESTSGLAKCNLGNKDIAIIREVGTLDSNGSFQANLAVNKDFYIWIKCTIMQKLSMAQIAVTVLSINGTAVFVSTHTDTKEEEQVLLPGTYTAKVRIPANFLNVGMYTLNVRIFGQLDTHMRASHANAFQVLTFRVEETGSVASRYSDSRGGVVTPILEWEIQQHPN
ncbi:MAG: ABC transporter ATP-binding protein [Bacillota bacterium]